MGEPSRRRVTYAQLENLYEFLNKRRDLATGYNKTSQARELSRRMWEEIAQNLNAHGGGSVKDGKGWSKYWNDYKSKLKKISVAAKESQKKTGGGPSTAKPMLEIEKKILAILGNDFGSGLPGIRVEPFEEETQAEVRHTPATSSGHNIQSNPSESILAGVDQIPFPSPPHPMSPAIPIPRRSPRRHPQTPPQHQSIRSTPRRSPRHRHLQTSPYHSIHSSFQHSPLGQRSPHRQHSPIMSTNLQPIASTSRHLPTRRQILPPSPPPPTSPATEQILPPPNTPPPAQPAHAAERLRRPRRVPPLTAEGARRAIIAETQKQTQLAEKKLEIWRNLITELREIKETLQQRY